MNQLDNLRQFTNIVADSGDIESIRQYKPQDATTNPSLILKVAKLSYYQKLLNDAILYAQKQGGSLKTQISNASDKLAVNIGAEILNIIPGRISTEIDARFSFNKAMCINKAHKLIFLYQKQGVNIHQVLIKIAATWEGIKAAEELEKEGINCNLTLIFSFAQAKACAEAKVYLISPFVGRIYDWYEKQKLINNDLYNKNVGINFIYQIYKHYKQYLYKTIIMGASFRKIDQILALAGCDSLTISPVLLEQLQKNNKPIERKLFPPIEVFHQPKPLSESEYRWEHNQNAMAVDKLAEGIRQFAIDQQLLEELISAKI